MMKLSVSVGRTMRRSGLRARTITVKLRDGDFTTRSRGRTVPEAVETDAAVFAVARELLGELRSRLHTPSRLLGVGLTNFVAGIDPLNWDCSKMEIESKGSVNAPWARPWTDSATDSGMVQWSPEES